MCVCLGINGSSARGVFAVLLGAAPAPSAESAFLHQAMRYFMAGSAIQVVPVPQIAVVDESTVGNEAAPTTLVNFLAQRCHL